MDREARREYMREWHARFLHYIKTKNMKPIEAATRAMREDEVLTEIYL